MDEEGWGEVSISVILKSLPADESLWRPYIEHLRALEEVAECRITVPEGMASALAALTSLSDDFFKVNLSGALDNDAALLNQTAALATSDTLLLLEKPFWLSVDDASSGWCHLEDSRSIKQLKRKISDRFGTSKEDNAQETALPVPDEALGMALLVSKKHFLEVRGYDEDESVSEALGFDLVLRQRRAGLPVDVARTGPHAYISNRDFGVDRANGAEVKGIAAATRTLYRNLESWSVDPSYREPLITVAIATKDRGGMLVESINSVLYQSFQEFEIVVVDDGSKNQEETRKLVEDLQDPRIRFYAHSESQGVAAARNTAAEHSRCLLTAVHDDDDLMLPDRLLKGIKPLSDEIDATYGSWINFDDKTGELKGFLTRVGFDGNLIAFNGSGPGHSTWTVPTRLVQQFRYDERLTSSVDHELAARLANSGVRWHHVQEFMYLRRVHDLQITSQDTDNQKAGHTLSKLANRFLTSECGRRKMAEVGRNYAYPTVRGSGSLSHEFSGYLPDHLVFRELVFRGNSVAKSREADMPERVTSIVTDRNLLDGKLVFEEGKISDLRQSELVELRTAGVTDFEVRGTVLRNEPSECDADLTGHRSVESEIEHRIHGLLLERLRNAADQLSEQLRQLHFVVVFASENSSRLEDHLFASKPSALRRIIATGEFGISSRAYLLGFKSARLAMLTLNNMLDLESSAEAFLMDEAPATTFADISQEIDDALIQETSDDSGLAGA